MCARVLLSDLNSDIFDKEVGLYMTSLYAGIEMTCFVYALSNGVHDYVHVHEPILRIN